MGIANSHQLLLKTRTVMIIIAIGLWSRCYIIENQLINVFFYIKKNSIFFFCRWYLVTFCNYYISANPYMPRSFSRINCSKYFIIIGLVVYDLHNVKWIIIYSTSWFIRPWYMILTVSKWALYLHNIQGGGCKFRNEYIWHL